MKQTNYEYTLTLGAGERRELYCKQWDITKHSLKFWLAEFADWLASPHTEPITLTAEERKAAELAVAIGLPWIKRDRSLIVLAMTDNSPKDDWVVSFRIPALSIFINTPRTGIPAWITAEPIDLRELLKEGNV